MKEKLISAMIDLLKVRSIITISLVWAMIFLMCKGLIAPKEIVPIVLIIIGFFFGTKQTQLADNQK